MEVLLYIIILNLLNQLHITKRIQFVINVEDKNFIILTIILNSLYYVTNLFKHLIIFFINVINLL